MSTLSYTGTTTIAVDDKGRITIPTRYRAALRKECDAGLALTRSLEEALMLFPRAVWEVHKSKISAWPNKAKREKMILLGSAEETLEMDSAGRLLIAPELRKSAGIEREVKLVGMGGYFEIWEPGRKTAFEAEVHDLPAEVEDYQF